MVKTRAERPRTNQRLEFLGDRVLGLIAAEMLYHAFPDEEEGAMAKRHSGLVRREGLARVADAIGLGEHVILSESEDGAGGRDNTAVLADCLEAVLAALYLDGGMAPARAFIEAHWTAMMAEEPQPPMDAKTELQELAQGKGLKLPNYREVGRSGPDHDPIFTIEVTVQGYPSASAEGGNKRGAEQEAARRLLKIMSAMGKDATT